MEIDRRSIDEMIKEEKKKEKKEKDFCRYKEK